jgi:hypothetical protein
LDRKFFGQNLIGSLIFIPRSLGSISLEGIKSNTEAGGRSQEEEDKEKERGGG